MNKVSTQIFHSFSLINKRLYSPIPKVNPLPSWGPRLRKPLDVESIPTPGILDIDIPTLNKQELDKIRYEHDHEKDYTQWDGYRESSLLDEDFKIQQEPVILVAKYVFGLFAIFFFLNYKYSPDYRMSTWAFYECIRRFERDGVIIDYPKTINERAYVDRKHLKQAIQELFEKEPELLERAIKVTQ